jgi:outer membrane protein TolC
VFQRYKGGTGTLIEALEARLEQISSERNLITAAGALAGEYVALHKALGLGWTPA